MDARKLDNPYLAPATLHVPSGPSTIPYAKIAGYAAPVGAAYGLLVGATSAFQCSFGLRRFGGLEYVPRVVVLSALRELAPSCAFALTCLTAVTLVHRASRDTVGAVTIEDRRAWIVGAATAVLAPIDVGCILAGALTVMRVAYALPAGSFVAALDTVTWVDLASAATKTAVFALLATLLLPRVLRLVAGSRRGLVVKLIVAWLGAQACELVVGFGVVAIFERWVG